MQLCDELSVESLGQNQHDVCAHVHDINSDDWVSLGMCTAEDDPVV